LIPNKNLTDKTKHKLSAVSFLFSLVQTKNNEEQQSLNHLVAVVVIIDNLSLCPSSLCVTNNNTHEERFKKQVVAMF
jgi:hypothetical protein